MHEPFFDLFIVYSIAALAYQVQLSGQSGSRGDCVLGVRAETVVFQKIIHFTFQQKGKHSLTGRCAVNRDSMTDRRRRPESAWALDVRKRQHLAPIQDTHMCSLAGLADEALEVDTSAV